MDHIRAYRPVCAGGRFGGRFGGGQLEGSRAGNALAMARWARERMAAAGRLSTCPCNDRPRGLDSTSTARAAADRSKTIGRGDHTVLTVHADRRGQRMANLHARSMLSLVQAAFVGSRGSGGTCALLDVHGTLFTPPVHRYTAPVPVPAPVLLTQGMGVVGVRSCSSGARSSRPRCDSASVG